MFLCVRVAFRPSLITESTGGLGVYSGFIFMSLIDCSDSSFAVLLKFSKLSLCETYLPICSLFPPLSRTTHFLLPYFLFSLGFLVIHLFLILCKLTKALRLVVCLGFSNLPKCISSTSIQLVIYF